MLRLNFMAAADSAVVLLEMGLGRNPLINGLIQHTQKINFLFVEQFPVIPFDYKKLFPVDHKSP